ncbi:MAG TPA: type II glyceraldehyde-3-phosphate dehydrogenase [Conexivisphaerales archaeon]|nr:type II glyceraldehyde-3-phosphate dehydrogenase [Conexivisphaerales archaeon]
MVKVAVNGYGVIGRRVADAVRLQKDMELLGIVKRTPDYRAFVARGKGIPVYATDSAGMKKLEDAGIKVAGLLDDLMRHADVMVDASPEGKGEENKKLYEAAGVKAIFQGGEEHSLCGVSFVAQCNFEQALGRRFVRVVSCNTTGLCRTLKTLDDALGVEEALATLVRRATDPDDSSKGPIDSIVPDPLELPSHHAEDVKSVLPAINLVTLAVKVPATHMHLHALALRVRKREPEAALAAISKEKRLLVVEGKKGFKSTSNVIDYAREIGRTRNDLYETAIWKESVKEQNGWLFLFQGVHQEAIVVPENIDAIRAVTETGTKESSTEATNLSLGIGR